MLRGDHIALMCYIIQYDEGPNCYTVDLDLLVKETKI
jgi:hypothetical protein